MRQSLKVLFAVVAVIATASAGVAAYMLSSAPSDPCSGLNLGLPPSNASPAFTPLPSISPSTVREMTPMTEPAARSRDTSSIPPIRVVAAENFWGNLVSQIGGNQTSVLSIVNEPNIDPHEYIANTSNALSISNAQLVIVNGAGYDDWALKLIAADGNPSQIVLNVATLNAVTVGGGIVGGNPHMWYSPSDVNRTLAAMYSDLASIRPTSIPTFQINYASLNVSLGKVFGQADTIRAQFAGTAIAATEDLVVYLANYTHLDLVSPPAFMMALAEGNDPTSQSLVVFECQLESGQVHVLIYNEQTVSATTTALKTLAEAHNVSVVGFSETVQPANATYQSWMESQLVRLTSALSVHTTGG